MASPSASASNSNHTYISWGSYGKLARSLARSVKASRQRFDLAIGIARGGVPLALVLADELGLRTEIINVKSYTGIKQREKPRILSTLTNGVKGKRVLLIDDLIDEGDTMKLVTGHIRCMSPTEIKTAVLFKKPQSKFNPDFCLQTVDKWIVFPWELSELKRSKSQTSRASKRSQDP